MTKYFDLTKSKLYSYGASITNNENRANVLARFNAIELAGMVFCYKNCTEIFWETIILVNKQNIIWTLSKLIFGKDLFSAMFEGLDHIDSGLLGAFLGSEFKLQVGS